MDLRDKISVAAVVAAVAIIAGLALAEDQSGARGASAHYNDVDRSAEGRPSSPGLYTGADVQGSSHARPLPSPRDGTVSSAGLSSVTQSPLNAGESREMADPLSPATGYPLVTCFPGGCAGI